MPQIPALEEETAVTLRQDELEGANCADLYNYDWDATRATPAGLLNWKEPSHPERRAERRAGAAR